MFAFAASWLAAAICMLALGKLTCSNFLYGIGAVMVLMTACFCE